MTDAALIEIAQAEIDGDLHVSPITAWEAGLAIVKKAAHKRPDLNGQDAQSWFSSGYRAMGAKVVPIKFRIAVEASRVPPFLGHGDPGDCYIIATARVRKLTIVTRDTSILELAKNQTDYIDAIRC